MPDVRGHNEGSIFQRPNGKRYAVVSVDGRRVSKRACPHVHKPSERHTTCPEARATLRAMLVLRERGREALDGSRMTLGQFLGGWLDDVKPRLAPATWRKHEQHIRLYLVPELGAARLSDLSVAHIRAYLRRHPELDPQTLRHHRATLRRALGDAVRDGLTTRNVAGLAEPPALPHRERAILTAAQARTLIEGTRDDRLHALWTLLVTTGLREAEALGLTWEDVNLGANDGPRAVDETAPTGEQRGEPTAPRTAPRGAARPMGPHAGGGRTPDGRERGGASVHVRHTLHRIDGEWQLRAPKTAKSRRTVILPAVTVEALRDHRRRQLEERLGVGTPTADGLVFVRPDGRPYHGSKLTTLLYPVLERLGLPKVTVHALRHSTATTLYAMGVPLETIADMLGHSTPRITAELYRHRVDELQHGAADAMQRAVG